MNDDLKELLTQTTRLSHMVFCLKTAKTQRGESFDEQDARALVYATTEFIGAVLVPYFKSQDISKEQWQEAVNEAARYVERKIKEEAANEQRPEGTH